MSEWSMSRVDLSTRVGEVVLPNPIMTASGTSGHGDELRRYLELRELGAVVVKSLAPYAWGGNAPQGSGGGRGRVRRRRGSVR